MDKHCKKCNETNPPQARYCRRCGERFSDWNNPAPKPKIVYRDKIVKVDKLPIWTIITLIALAIISGVLIWYSYRLEDENYIGSKYLSNVLGEKEYLKVNGCDSVAPLVFTTNDIAQFLNVSSNGDYHIEGLPSWCLIQDSTSNGFSIKPFANYGSFRYDTCYLVTNEQYRIALPIYQKGLCEAKIESVKACNNVANEYGQYGIEFRLKMKTTNMKDNPGLITIYFSDQEYNAIIKNDSIYTAPNGQLCLSESFTPKYKNSTFNSFRMFLPYSALEGLNLDDHVLFHAVVWDSSYGAFLLLADSGYYSLRTKI